MPTLRIIDTTREIRASAAAWDDLWRRSGVPLPSRRAALMALWIDRFAPREALSALVVEDRGQFVAALPLILRKLGRVLSAGMLPMNCWSSAGDLLLDESCDQEGVLACLVGGVRRLPWPLLWLDTIETGEPRWIAFQSACRNAGLPVESQVQFDLGLIDVGHDWEAYRERWSKNLRRDMTRRLRKAENQGALGLEVHTHLALDQVEPLVVSGFEVEDKSWKGPAGTSVIRSPGMLEFYVEQARRLAEIGQLQLSFLMLNDWPIAFEYGYEADGVHYSHKAGYDEAYRDLAPGQLLMMKLLERSHQSGHIRLHNCMGVLTDAVAKWCTRVRPMGRLVVGTGGPVAAASMFGYRRLWPLARRVRRTANTVNDGRLPIRPGCARPGDTARRVVSSTIGK